MIRSQKDAATRVAEVADAWEKRCPGKRFFGRTVVEFRAEVKPFVDALMELRDLQAKWDDAVYRRDLASGPAMKLVKGVVNAVKGDPEEGEDGPLYAAMGYVPASQRNTGLTRRRKTEPSGQEGDSA
jgi:hypothetical protein